MQQDLQLSNKQVKILAHGIRTATGSRKAVETGMTEKLFAKNHHLDDFFEVRKLVYRREIHGEDKEKRIEENFKHDSRSS